MVDTDTPKKGGAYLCPEDNKWYEYIGKSYREDFVFSNLDTHIARLVNPAIWKVCPWREAVSPRPITEKTEERQMTPAQPASQDRAQI